jgi:hypothetical protein
MTGAGVSRTAQGVYLQAATCGAGSYFPELSRGAVERLCVAVAWWMAKS